jgi:hypothetical protein
VEEKIMKELPVLLIDVVGAGLGFVIAVGWWKASGRDLDRQAIGFLAKLFGGIGLIGMILAFIM